MPSIIEKHHLGAEIATTQFSPELNNLDWGGSIIAKINHNTQHHTTPCDDFFDQYKQVSSSVVQDSVAKCSTV